MENSQVCRFPHDVFPSPLKLELFKTHGTLGIRTWHPEIDIVQRAAALKLSLAGYICRRGDGRWSRVILDWQPRTGHSSIGRPSARWRDDNVKAVEKKP
ncbi:jg5696 [Pararge aegeria aegeria]|uniref:Jg5696 protein n=1 Tax=Pararge aegeria aegeria TaxID=348720 RepID=A0A8S4SJ01_9NEOP|nr:jg5696 [Pararge aegeria aegeria]